MQLTANGHVKYQVGKMNSEFLSEYDSAAPKYNFLYRNHSIWLETQHIDKNILTLVNI